MKCWMLTQRLTEDYVYMISTAPDTQNDTCTVTEFV